MENLLYNICQKIVNSSNSFEINNSDLKREYLILNIMLFNNIASKINGCNGTFGTGYPFYALGKNITGKLPVINEQIRYNNELSDAIKNSNTLVWNCYNCLQKNGKNMPDLKQICKPCPNMNNALKPRELLKRIPDIDMWMICDKDKICLAKESLITQFKQNNMLTSDINPIQAIDNLIEIAENLKDNIMPKKLLPIDAHIIDNSTIYLLIEQVPEVLKQANESGKIPYLPIHPLSYRKKWQYDDEAYNFIHDYLSSLTKFNWDYSLENILSETRREISNRYTDDQLYNWLIITGPESVKRRHKTKELQCRFKERINLWKK